MNTTDIEGMSITERIHAMEAIWDSLLKSDSDLESPDWHQDVLAERRRSIEEGSSEFVSLADSPMRRPSPSIKPFATP